MIATFRHDLTIAAILVALALATLLLCPAALADDAVVHVSGALTEDTTWDAGTVYVVDSDLTISVGVVLTVTSGTVVKFDRYADLVVEGRLALGEEPEFTYICLPVVRVASTTQTSALGASGSTARSTQPSAAQPVILTSLADDSSGGDTNGNGNANEAAMGDWGGVFFEDPSLDSSYMQGFEIRYSGVPYNSATCGAIVLDNASPELADGTFTDNQINGIQIPRANWLTDMWDAKGMVYHLTDNVTVPRGNNLTIPPGTVIKAARHKRLVIEGALHAVGSEDRPIVMTSWRDETASGATYADSDGLPATSDWGGIDFTEESGGYHSVLDHVELRYTGRGLIANTAPVQLHNCSPILRNLTFVEGYVHGVSLEAERDELTTLALASQTVPYIIADDLVVPRHEMLMLEPGVVLKFKRIQSLRVEGALHAVGESWNPIILTSFYDDSALGDTDTGGITPAPAPGDWGCIAFEPGSDDGACQMRYVTVRYGGADGLDFTTNMGPLRIDNANPSLSSLTLEENKLNALSVAPGDWSTCAWTNVDLVYFVGDDITVLSGQTLTIGPGVVVKVLNPVAPTNQPQITVRGALQVGSYGAAQAVITSGRDDQAGPANAPNWDSNGDGSASAPAVNDWAGIVLESDADGGSSYMRNTLVKYGGLSWATFVDPQAAVRMNGVSMPIDWCQFLGNYRGVEALDGAAPTISTTVFEDNVDYAVYNGSPGSATVHATGNWWGDATGPSSDGQGCNPATGYGDTVSCGVDFGAWLTEQP